RLGRRDDVGITEDEQYALRRAAHQLRRRREHERARALRADQRAGDVEPVLGQQLVEVVARDAALDLREARADQLAVAVGEARERRVDLAAAPARRDDRRELGLGRRPGAEARAVAGE